MYVNVKSENHLALACLGKKIRISLVINQISELYFLNLAFLKTSRSCSSPTKIVVSLELLWLYQEESLDFVG